MRLKLETQEDVIQAVALASWLGRPTVREVVVGVPWLDAGERTRAATTIRRLFNDCGCAVAAVAFVATLLAVLLPRVLGQGWSWLSVGTAVGAGVAAAVAGKLAGLAWSRQRLRSRLRRLARAGPVPRWEGLGKPPGP